MLTFKEYLTEVFNKPYEWRWVSTGGRKIEAFAKTEHGEKLFVVFTNEVDEFFLQFEINGEIGITGTKDPFKILATVLDIVRAFVVKYKDANRIFFQAKKDTLSRAGVYEKMLKRFLPSTWEVEKTNTPQGINFVLKKK